MAFVKSLNMTIATLSAKSDKILSSFSKTKEDLISLNKSLDSSILENKAQIEYLNTETNQMLALKEQHAKVISNIDTLLGN